MSTQNAGHFFSYQRGNYQIEQLFDWVNANPNRHCEVPIETLLEYVVHDTWNSFEELRRNNFRTIFEDNDHFTRMKKVDLSYPIILTNLNILVDGVHRLFRSIFDHRTTVKAIFISNAELDRVRTEIHRPFPKSSISGVCFEDQYLTLPIGSLPEDEGERRILVEDYFCDLLPTVKIKDGSYEVCLERPSTPYGSYLHDPQIRDGLGWWKEGTRVRDLPGEYQLYEQGMLALEEQWIPLSWSTTFAKQGYIPNEIVLLHLDDHRDMMSPRVGLRLDGQLVDYITSEEIDLMKPESVKNAIISGAIGKGSILTPLINVLPKVHVRHLSFRPYPSSTYHLNNITFTDSILFPKGRRIGLNYQDSSWDNVSMQSNYIVTPDIQTWLKALPKDVPILLHFDMDYFNNRFDGCSDWQEDGQRSHEIPLNQQLDQLNAIFKSLESHQLFDRIINTTIGISPGFFPAEHWPTMVKELKDLLRSHSLLF